MTKQLLIYERAVPVSAKAHGDVSVAATGDLSFAKPVNSLPLVAAEFLAASNEYAIVFAGEGNRIMPSVILGIRDGENAFVDADGSWGGRYVPAFLRRYPFVFARAEEGGDFTLCVDEEFEGLNRDGRGERLFDSEGKRTQYLDSIVSFVSQYQGQFDATQRFCDRLQNLDLFEPAQAQFRLPGGENSQLSGFMRVSREKLKALSDDTLLALAKSDELELIHAHLHSLENIRGMAERLAKRSAPAPADEASQAPAEPEDA